MGNQTPIIPGTSLPKNWWDLNSRRKPLSGIPFFCPKYSYLVSLPPLSLLLCVSAGSEQYQRRRKIRREDEDGEAEKNWGCGEVRSSRERKNNWRMGEKESEENKKKNQKGARRRRGRIIRRGG